MAFKFGVVFFVVTEEGKAKGNIIPPNSQMGMNTNDAEMHMLTQSIIEVVPLLGEFTSLIIEGNNSYMLFKI